MQITRCERVGCSPQEYDTAAKGGASDKATVLRLICSLDVDLLLMKDSNRICDFGDCNGEYSYEGVSAFEESNDEYGDAKNLNRDRQKD